jgi:hypothetical protein
MKKRGLFATSTDRMYAVYGSKLYELATDGTKTERGQLNTTTGRLHFSENETQLIIIDGQDGWILQLVNIYDDDGRTVLIPANGWYNIAASQLDGHDGSGYEPGRSIVNISGYFVQAVNDSPTRRGWALYSDLRDGLTWDGSHVVAEGSPDALVAVAKINGELVMLGTKTTQFYYFTGDPNTPFASQPQGYLDIGCVARESVAVFQNTLFWLGGSQAGQGLVWMTSSYQPQKISNHGIEAKIAAMSDISDATAYCYQEEGHVFYVLKFPTGNATFVYDAATGLWHERATFTNNKNEAWLPDFFAFWRGKNYVASENDGKIYELSLANIQQDLEPIATLQCSNDGGYSWGNEISMSMGKLGERLVRYHTHRLGQSRDRAFRVIYTDTDTAGFTNRRVRTSPHVHNDRKRLFYDEFEVDFERGIGGTARPPVLLGARMDAEAEAD